MCFAGCVLGRFQPDFKRSPTAAMAADHGVLGLVGGLREPGETNNPSVRTVEGACGRAVPDYKLSQGANLVTPPNALKCE